MLLSNLFSKKKSNASLGVSLRQHSVDYCYLSENDAICGTFPLPSPADYATVISQISGERGVEPCPSTIILSATQSQTVQIEKPSVPDTELNSSLKWQIKDLVSYSPDNIVVDYYDGPVSMVGQEKINVVCTAKSDLLNVINPLLDSDFDVNTISIEEFAFASLAPQQEHACLMVCQQPNEEVILLIVKQGKIYFSRRLRGFAQLANKSEDELGFGVIDSLSLEIQRSTDFFERQLKQAPIQSIQVMVPIKHEGFLARKLAEYTNVAVEILPLPAGFENKRAYAATISAAQMMSGKM